MASFATLQQLEKTIDDPTPSWSSVFFSVLSWQSRSNRETMTEIGMSIENARNECRNRMFAVTERCIFWDQKKKAATHIPTCCSLWKPSSVNDPESLKIRSTCWLRRCLYLITHRRCSNRSPGASGSAMAECPFAVELWPDPSRIPIMR